MNKKTIIKDNNLAFILMSPQEMCFELAKRLRLSRVAQKVKQEELAQRSGVSLGTIKNLETKGQCTLLNLMKVVLALGLQKELENLFIQKIHSIAEMEKWETFKLHKTQKRVR